MSFRQEKITSLLREIASKILLDFKFEKAITAVQNIEISKDFKKAKIFVSIFPEDKEKEALKFFNKEKKKIRKKIAGNIRLKFVPQIEFKIDKGERNRQRIEELLENYQRANQKIN